jgi:hypothetical protein
MAKQDAPAYVEDRLAPFIDRGAACIARMMAKRGVRVTRAQLLRLVGCRT